MLIKYLIETLKFYLWHPMQQLRRFLSVILLAVISFYSAPKELLHQLTNHHDTEDVICTNYCKQHFTNEHKHCEVLQLTTPPFNHPINTLYFISDKLPCTISFESTGNYHSSYSPFLFFRGPPSLI